MKRFFTFLLGIGTFLTVAFTAYADNAELISFKTSVENEFQIQAKAAQNKVSDFILEQSPAMKLTVSQDAQLTAPKVAKARKVRANASRKVSAADLKGYFVGSYKTLTSSSFNGGSTMQIVPDASGDSITINYFWNGQPVRAHLDPATNKVTIPRQQILVDADLGRLDIAVANSNGTPNYSAQITGTVTDNGIDFSEAWWAIYVQTAGTNKDKFVAAYFDLNIQKANGTFTYQSLDATSGKMVDYGYYILVKQKSNTLTVTNIFNRGLDITVLLNRDRTAEISNQVALINGNGSWVLIKCLAFNEAGNLTSYSPIITTDKAADNNNTTLTWTDWSIFSAEVMAYAGKLENAKLTANTPFSYPVLSETSFEGEGTEASPYLIKNRDHLILLADQVRDNTVQTGMYYNNPFYSLYIGKHFALANDIDLDGYRLEPIGGDLLHRFGGTFDGKGHTLKNVYVDGGSKYYSGLFGVCDTLSVIKNLNVENLTVNSDYSPAAGVVAWNIGSTDNVHVINPQITSARSVAGGIVGIAVGPVTNCSVKEGLVVTPMYSGGAVAEAHGGISDVSVFGTQVYMSGSGGPSGGVVANMLCDGTKLSFSGLVRYNGDGQQFLGGVAGMLQNGTLSKSYSGGMVRGYSSDSYIGGLVGYCRGYVEDCYSSGVVQCYSRMTGGLIGVLSTMTGVETPSVRNSYTSALTICETYQYNRENCNEIIGQIPAGVTPVLENIYANRQITNFYSTRFASNTAELTAATGPKGFSSDNWVFTEGAYPRVKGLEDTPTAQYTASAVDFSPIDNVKKLSNNTPLKALGNTEFFFNVGGKLTKEGHYAKIVDNKMIEISSNFGTDTLYMVNGSVQSFMFLSVAPIPFEGEGTEISPFLIKSKADLVALSQATTDKGQTFPNLYFRQTNDIDMELTEDFLVISGKASDTYNRFEGVYDGGGYTIDNLNVANRVAWTTPISEGKLGTLNTSQCQSYSGLFGRVGENGIVRNVTIGAGSKLDDLYGTSGAVVGNLMGGLIENCRNYAYVHGYSCWIGGIVGKTEKGSTVRNCYNAGRVTTCYNNAGGIVGSSTATTVENCVNTGDVDVLVLITNYANLRNRVGGISGGTTTGSIYKNNVNFGTVSAVANTAGGITAALENSGTSIAAMYNCMNFGNVYSGDAATNGAISGLVKTDSVANVYYDLQNIGIKAGQNADMTGVTGATTAFLTSGKAIEGFDAEVWDFTAGMYPTIKLFANEDKVKAARKVYISMPEEFTVANYITTGELSDAASWKLTDGTIFKIEGNKLVGPSAVDNLVTDTLYATNSCGVVRPILLTAKPTLKLSGNGSKETPYLVNNVEDWKTLCEYIHLTFDDLEGKFVSITADLDFNNAASARLCADGITGFAGVLDGGDHTFKNVALTPAANSNSALIGTVKEGGVVKNFTFEGTVNSAYTYAAPVVDKLYGTIENVESKAKVTTNKQYASGVVANTYDGAVLNKVKFSGSIESNQTYIGGVVAVTVATGKTTFNDCTFTGKINSTRAVSGSSASASYIGGLVASCGSADFNNCYSDGTIELANTLLTTLVGGLVGNAAGNKDYPLYTFTKCYNSTPITAGGGIAGIVGGTPTTSTAAANARYKFVDCYNTGDMSAKSAKALSSSPTAGLIVNITPGSSFTRCHNEGTLTSDKNVYVGGMSGYLVGTPGSTATPDSIFFTDCWNEGLIIADGNQGGGIAGYASGAVIIKNCYNTADLEGGQMVGGIVSAFSGTGPQMINCYNTGNITTKFGRAAGLIAWGGSTNGLVKGCWNTGTISSTATVGGTSAANGAWAIGGIAAAQSATFEDCYNAGALKGMARVGGIVGEPTKAKTSFKNCYNAGEITAPADSCGYIVGVNIVNGKIWTEDNKVENCYFIDGKASTLTVPEGATAVTIKELAGKKISDGYTLVDNYSYPVVAGFEDNKTAVFYAAQVIPAEGNELNNITGDFHVGGASLLTWTSTCPVLQFSGSDAKFTSSYSGEFTVTASNGDLSKNYELKASGVSGVDEIGISEAISVRYFTPAGIEVKEPVAGEIYIAVSKYADGTTKTQKVTYVK